jgi:beta-ribofuranosylaminobenzene 5'-phosphate synthase
MTPAPENFVQVRAPARLHMGFLALHERQGRSFGGLGLAIEEISTELTAVRGDGVSARGVGAERAAGFARDFIESWKPGGGVDLHLHGAIPEHSGLGSGTQMALAVGAAISRLYGLSLSTEHIATAAGRGRRSGIGIGVFRAGGLIVDGGRGTATTTPPVSCRMPVPETWRFVLVQDRLHSGLSGAAESDAFSRLAGLGTEASAELCRIVLLELLPALAESDCAAFGAAVTHVQSAMSGCFHGIQNGPFTSATVGRILGLLHADGAAGYGQSSWGPTGFAIYSSETEAFQALRRLRAGPADIAGLDFVICRARNTPAAISVDDAMVRNIRRR